MEINGTIDHGCIGYIHDCGTDRLQALSRGRRPMINADTGLLRVIWIAAALATLSLATVTTAAAQSGYGTKVFLPLEGFTGDIRTALGSYSTIGDIAPSPDGQWIAFVTNTGSEIWIVPSAGGQQQMVYKINDDPNRIDPSLDNLRFSPNSREIFFRSTYFDSDRGSVRIQTGSQETWYNPLHDLENVDIFTGEHRILVEGASTFDISSDGRFMVFERLDYQFYLDEMSADHNGVMTVMDTATGNSWYLSNEEQSTCHHADPDNPSSLMTGVRYHVTAISGDNNSVYYIRDNFDTITSGLYRIPLFGGQSERLDHDSWPQVSPELYRLSPDLNWLLYRMQSYQDVTMFAFDTRAQQTYTLAESTSIMPEKFPCVWTHDGTRICCVFENETLASEYRQTYGVDIDGICELYVIDFNPESLIPLAVSKEAPESFITISNNPNPFNPATTITVTLAEPGFAEVAVYTSSGQRVRNLFSGRLAAGDNQLVWDGCDNDGIIAASGVYVAKLKNGMSTVGHPMTLVR